MSTVTSHYLTPDQAEQLVIDTAKRLGIDPNEALSLWQQESGKSIDTSLPGQKLSKGRGNAVGPFQVVPYYHPNFPVKGTFAEQVNYALSEWKKGGNTIQDRTRNYYGSGKPPAGHPTPDQYAAQVASRVPDTRMADTSGMETPAVGPEELGQQPLTNDVIDSLPTGDNSVSLNGGLSSQDLINQYLQSVSNPQQAPQYKQPSLKDAMLEMGLGILANPAGAMASPLSGIARGMQQGLAVAEEQAQAAYERQRQAAEYEQKKQHDMLYAAQIAAQSQHAAADSAGGGKDTAFMKDAQYLAQLRGRSEPNEQDINDALRRQNPELTRENAVARESGVKETKAVVKRLEEWPATESLYANVISTVDDASQIIQRMITMLRDNPTYVAGGFGGMLKYLPETDARSWDDLNTTLKSNIAIETLKELKRLSPTGASGLGALSEGELRVITNILGTTNQMSDPIEIANVLNGINKKFMRMKEEAIRKRESDKIFIDNNSDVAPRLAPTPNQTPAEIYDRNMGGQQSPQPVDLTGWSVVR